MQFTRRRKKKISLVEIAYYLVRTLLMSNNVWNQNLISYPVNE